MTASNQVAEASGQYLFEVAGQVVPVGYKQTEVGVIPQDWLVKNLKDYCELTSSKRIFESDYVSDGIPFYRGQEISSLLERKDIGNLCFISREKFNLLEKRFGVPKCGDILITAVGTLGNAFLINNDERFYFKDGNLIWLRKISGVSPTYLSYQLHALKQIILDGAIGSSQKALTMVVLKELPIPAPFSEKEQTAIANALSDVDTLISELEKLIAKKQAIKTATLQQLLTGRTRLPQFALREDGTPKGYKPSELGEIPEDWVVYFLSEVIQKTQLGGNYGNTEKETDYPLIKMGNLDRGAIKLDKLEYVTSLPNQNDLLKYGDVLFNTRNTLELVGKVAIWRNELPQAYFNSNLMRLFFKEQLVSSRFYVSATMNTKQFISALAGIATGTTSVAAIYTRDLVTLKICLPPKQEQTAIATILSDMDSEIQALQQRLAKTRYIKQGMMQELLTGKTRLI